MRKDDIGNWGKVRFTKGEYKGRFGFYDDEEMECEAFEVECKNDVETEGCSGCDFKDNYCAIVYLFNEEDEDFLSYIRNSPISVEYDCITRVKDDE